MGGGLGSLRRTVSCSGSFFSPADPLAVSPAHLEAAGNAELGGQLTSAESEPAFSQMPGRHMYAVNSDYRVWFSVVAQWKVICLPVEEMQETWA